MSSLSLSPFAGIIETQKYPHARTQRTSFSHKLLDCFAVVVGTTPTKHISPTQHVGIFDYLTLFIPYFFAKLFNRLQSNNPYASFLDPLIILNLLLLIPRLALGAVVTVLFSPLIAAVHGISRLLTSKKTYTDALEVCGLTGSRTSFISLRLYMETNGIRDVEALNTRIWQTDYQSFELLFSLKRIVHKTTFQEFKEQAFSIPVSTAANQMNNLQNVRLHHLFRLNIGNVVKTIENMSDPAAKAAILGI